MAQCENISLGVTLTDSQQKQPSQKENQCEKHKVKIHAGSFGSVKNNFGSLTHPPGPAGGWCDGTPPWWFCRRTTAELCEWLRGRQNARCENTLLEQKGRTPTQHSFYECLELPELSDEWCKGLWEPNKFTLVLFWKRNQRDRTMLTFSASSINQYFSSELRHLFLHCLELNFGHNLLF